MGKEAEKEAESSIQTNFPAKMYESEPHNPRNQSRERNEDDEESGKEGDEADEEEQQLYSRRNQEKEENDGDSNGDSNGEDEEVVNFNRDGESNEEDSDKEDQGEKSKENVHTYISSDKQNYTTDMNNMTGDKCCEVPEAEEKPKHVKELSNVSTSAPHHTAKPKQQHHAANVTETSGLSATDEADRLLFDLQNFEAKKTQRLFEHTNKLKTTNASIVNSFNQQRNDKKEKDVVNSFNQRRNDKKENDVVNSFNQRRNDKKENDEYKTVNCATHFGLDKRHLHKKSTLCRVKVNKKHRHNEHQLKDSIEHVAHEFMKRHHHKKGRKISVVDMSEQDDMIKDIYGHFSHNVKDIKNADNVFIRKILKLTKTPYGLTYKKHKVPSRHAHHGHKKSHKAASRSSHKHAKHTKPHKKAHISKFHMKVSNKRMKKNHKVNGKSQRKSTISKRKKRKHAKKSTVKRKKKTKKTKKKKKKKK